jgi:hypothetical protein
VKAVKDSIKHKVIYPKKIIDLAEGFMCSPVAIIHGISVGAVIRKAESLEEMKKYIEEQKLDHEFWLYYISEMDFNFGKEKNFFIRFALVKKEGVWKENVKK